MGKDSIEKLVYKIGYSKLAQLVREIKVEYKAK